MAYSQALTLALIATAVTAQPTLQQPVALDTTPAGSTYQCFLPPVPSSEHWLSYDALWRINQPMILHMNGGDTNIVHDIHDGISQVASEAGFEASFMLAIMMEEVGNPGANDARIPMLTSNHSDRRPSGSTLRDPGRR